MILNAYAVLAGLVALGQLLAGALVVALAVPAWRRARSVPGPERRAWLEDRGYLLLLLAVLLVVMNVASWPLLYLLLESYVPEWPGVMCIYGVTRIGAGSPGSAAYLPPLLLLLQLTKPALVFLSGAWLVLYRINRRTQTGPLLGRVLLVLGALGALAVADATAELAYLAIPKKEEALAAGCCTEASAEEQFAPRALLDEGQRPWLAAAFYTANAAMGVAAAWAARRQGIGRAGIGGLLVGATGALAVNLLFLSEIAAPALLRQPFHHCPYDLIHRAPESVVAVGLLVLGSFSVGWAAMLSLGMVLA
jgi:hypothetical protein